VLIKSDRTVFKSKKGKSNSKGRNCQMEHRRGNFGLHVEKGQTLGRRETKDIFIVQGTLKIQSLASAVIPAYIRYVDTFSRSAKLPFGYPLLNLSPLERFQLPSLFFAFLQHYSRSPAAFALVVHQSSNHLLCDLP